MMIGKTLPLHVRRSSTVGFVIFVSITVVLVALAFGTRPALSASSYTVQDLGDLGGNQSYAKDTNGSEQVVGYSFVVGEGYHAINGEEHGFLLTPEAVPQDITDPTVDVITPEYGVRYAHGQQVLADYSCEDEDGGSGLASCEGTVPDGQPLDTSSPGTKSFTVTAEDNAGNRYTVTNIYTVRECTVVGTPGDDTLGGTEGDDVICGLGGNDIIKGFGGYDILSGGEGNDNLAGGTGDDEISGEAGGDTVSFVDSLYNVDASLRDPNDGFAAGEGFDFMTGVEHLEGSRYADILRGSDVANRLSGLGGGDLVFGYGAGDRITGGSSRDQLYGGPGKDSILGGTGADSHFGETGEDALDSRDGVSGNDDLDGGPYTDTCLTDPTEKSVLRCEA